MVRFVNGIVAFRISWFASPVKKFATWPSMPRISFGPAFEKFWNRLLASAPDDTKSTWMLSGFPDASPKTGAGLGAVTPLIWNVIVNVALASGGFDAPEPTVSWLPRLAVRTIGFVIVPPLVKSTADVPISPRLIRPSLGRACGSLSVRLTFPLNETPEARLIVPSSNERLILIVVPAAM